MTVNSPGCVVNVEKVALTCYFTSIVRKKSGFAADVTRIFVNGRFFTFGITHVVCLPGFTSTDASEIHLSFARYSMA